MSDYGSLLTRFAVDVAERRRQEERLSELKAGPNPEQVALRTQLETAKERYAQEIEQLEEEYLSVRNDVSGHFEKELEQHQNAYEMLVRSLNAQADQASLQLEQKREDSEWVVSSVLDDSAEDSPLREYQKFESIQLKTQEEQESFLLAFETQLKSLAEERNWTIDDTPPHGRAYKKAAGALEQFKKTIEASESVFQTLRSLIIPRLFSGFRGLIVFAVFTLIATVPIYMFVAPLLVGVQGVRFQPSWVGIASGGGMVAGLLMTTILYSLGAMRQSDLFRQLEQLHNDAQWSHAQWMTLVQEDLKKQEKIRDAKQRRIERERDLALNRYEATHAEIVRGIETERQENLKQEEAKYNEERAQTIAQRDQQLQQIDSGHQRGLDEAKTRWGEMIENLESRLNQIQSEQSRQNTELWISLKSFWETSCNQFLETINTINQADQETNQNWNDITEENWYPRKAMPRGIRHGRVNIDLHNWPDAIPEEMRLAPRTTTFSLPGQVEFPGTTSTLFKSPNHTARTQAIDALQTMMLRMLLLIPPGKLRFTLIDPIGLGESFGGFMHLADYDELMVTNRIWTETGQIEARLADLTEHMENVFQTYLRNEFQTIEEYNESAGEVAEPYHILVISDFPAKFSEIAARRLVSIVNSGPRCGVYTLMNMDPTKPLPNNFELTDLEPHMTGYEWKDKNFHATEPALAPWPISIDPPPEPAQFTSIVKMVGEASKDARRVEVSFDRIAPQPSEIWSRDSRHELEIPLGRAGATKLQSMRLGKGTSQHMLVAGKTGSGKSTFLHIMITNLALHYGPDEVNFFLIDFKKGVEFKDYATNHLPHAKVIAIESDREFGVSALQRLDQVLEERGELFRRHGVQDVAGFRDANPNTPLPRILLIVDEFQEFFIEDDKLSDTAAKLLDRLVRQGRAFGVHVILGSQTLGGAYSLARTTLGQVAVRVALQCSEADAHLILSEENTAARLLTRPGEAIYNDANGMMQGNHPFQIGWLGDQERREYLETLNKKAERLGIESDPPIVFEGNIPSDLRINQELQKLGESFSTREKPLPAPTIWLGDAVEIQPPTAIQFHRQSGSHLLVVGQDSLTATGILTSAAMTFAASSCAEPAFPTLHLFDGNPPETEEAKRWKTILNSLPTATQYVTPREAAESLESLTAELERRTENPDDQHPPVFVLIHNIAKFRDLRKVEDDYGLGGFGSSAEEKPADPGKLFSNLLTEGPIFGIHFVIWCDSYNNVERCFSRHTMKEFELRVAMQMNQADSSNLIESPIASRLGTHRAFLHREETGLSEKFRPYGVPPQEWVDQFTQTMKHGSIGGFATDLDEFSIL
ncbi:FtsK/SpoIIIE domain-containing protein [Thalassoglobus sp.]|uniref:FtsK/SpoIIIE domain-containing protein n=1 Tax=Thalassoglobus sp. TaxID=2795869 RepID=UPI003AA98E0D